MGHYGHTNVPSVVGLLVFTHTWFWFPLSHFLCLSFQPTCLIGLNKDLKMPAMKFRSCARPATYAYPPLLEPPKEKEKEKVSTAVLSTTAKKAAKSKAATPAPMEVEEKKDTTKEEEEKKKKEEKKEEKKEDKKDEKKDEKKEDKKDDAKFELLSNPARVMIEQRNIMDIPADCRYSTVWKKSTLGGFVVLRDSKEGTEEQIIESLKPAMSDDKSSEEEEPSPPEPFEYTE